MLMTKKNYPYLTDTFQCNSMKTKFKKIQMTWEVRESQKSKK